MKQTVPDVIKGFGSLFQAAMKDGALKAKEKKLVALGTALRAGARLQTGTARRVEGIICRAKDAKWAKEILCIN
jgi:alkylhydroperoxidase/carboxymuconolactone decarboxylase family protein YurZ